MLVLKKSMGNTPVLKVTACAKPEDSHKPNLQIIFKPSLL